MPAVAHTTLARAYVEGFAQSLPRAFPEPDVTRLAPQTAAEPYLLASGLGMLVNSSQVRREYSGGAGNENEPDAEVVRALC